MGVGSGVGVTTVAVAMATVVGGAISVPEREQDINKSAASKGKHFSMQIIIALGGL